MPHQTRFEFNLFRALEVFSAVAETRHLTRAADMLGMTQSAVSQQLKNLEKAIGADVLDRSARPIALTPAGHIVKKRAQRILNEIDDLQFEVQRLDIAPIPLLRFAILPSIATTLTSALIKTAKDKHGVPEVSMFAGLASDHLGHLQNRRTDILITSDPLYEMDGLERIPVLQETFLLITPQSYKGDLKNFNVIIRDLPLVRFHSEAPVGRLTDRHLRRLRIELPRTIEADRASMVIAAVAAGEGFALLTPSLLIDGLMEQLPINASPMPIRGFGRTITVIARRDEFGDIPQDVALEVQRLLNKSFESLSVPALSQAAKFLI